MKANPTPRHQPLQLPAAFVHWWLSDAGPLEPRPDDAHGDDAAEAPGRPDPAGSRLSPGPAGSR